MVGSVKEDMKYFGLSRQAIRLGVDKLRGEPANPV